MTGVCELGHCSTTYKYEQHLHVLVAITNSDLVFRGSDGRTSATVSPQKTLKPYYHMHTHSTAATCYVHSFALMREPCSKAPMHPHIAGRAFVLIYREITCSQNRTYCSTYSSRAIVPDVLCDRLACIRKPTLTLPHHPSPKRLYENMITF